MGNTHPGLSKRLLEPWVLEKHFGSGPVRRVLSEALHEEIAHLLAARIRNRREIIIHDSVHDWMNERDGRPCQPKVVPR
jgi:hypothetical protein